MVCSYRQRKYVVFSIIVFILSSCVTQKRRDDISGMSKLYQNTTAKYNGYFNANELVYLTTLKLEEQHQDNYTQLLPVYDYVDVENPAAVAPDMDQAIQKLSVVINLHRVSKWTDDSYLMMGKAQFLKHQYQDARETFEYLVDEFDPDNVKNNRRATQDEQAKARNAKMKERKKQTSSKKKSSSNKSTKKEREAAIKNNSNSKKNSRNAEKARQAEIKARKKAIADRKKNPPANESAKPEEQVATSTPAVTDPATENKPNSKAPVADSKKKDQNKEPEKAKDNDKPFGEAPAYYEGMVWLARSQTAQGNYYACQSILNELKLKTKAPTEVMQMAAVAEGDNAIRQENYALAILSLQKGYDLSEDKKERARLAFILGQLFELNGDANQALAHYTQVLDNRPGYDLEFNAKLKQVVLQNKAGTLADRKALDAIDDMIKEAKNAEYRDQLYYALAQIDLSKGDRAAAIEHLKLSVRQPAKLQLQKAESYYLLASLYYEKDDFSPAYHYYDSTQQFMLKTDERLDKVQDLAISLKPIAEQVDIITLTDSLIRVSQWPDDKKRELAARLKKQQEEEQAAKNVQSTVRPDPLAARATPGQVVRPGQAGSDPFANSTFFAYDDKELKRGLKEFSQKWGNRANEDNWRRSLRPDANQTEQAVAEQQPATDQVKDDEIYQILKDVPRNAQDLARAKSRIEDARFRLGILLRDNIDRYQLAADQHELLLSEYPETSHKEETYYYLYLDYSDLNDLAKASRYKDGILSEFPQSKFAVVLKDPDYYARQETPEQKLAAYYQQVFDIYSKGDYQQATQLLEGVEGLFGKNNALKAKFALLGVFCIGGTEGKDAYTEALKQFIANYPNTDEQIHARELLRLLYGGDPNANVGTNSSSIVTYKDEGNDVLHYFLIILYNSKDASLNDAKSNVYNFNSKYFSNQKFQYSSIGLDVQKEIPVIIIRDFKTKQDAMAYFETVEKNKKDFLPDRFRYDAFPISLHNWRQLQQSKRVEDYRTFFNQNYNVKK